MTDSKEQSTRFVTLTITHRCNLDCIYCYEKHKDSSHMSVETAIRLVENELIANNKYCSVEFDFFGGEPLIEYSLIHDVVEHVKANVYPKSYFFTLTTNGTLLNDSMKQWFSENTDIIQMGLSLDGCKDSHDYNRSNSFDLIDLDFFRVTYPEQEIKMTISQYSLGKLFDNVVFCHNLGFKVNCNLAYNIDWSEPNNCYLLETELKKLIEYYLGNDIEPCSMLDFNKLINVGINEKMIHRNCGAGWSMVAFDIDCTKYPCQYFLPTSIGTELAEKSKTLYFKQIITNEPDFPEDCRKCCLVNCCPSCYGSNYASTGNMYVCDPNMCKLIKIQFKAKAYFVSRLFEEKRLNLKKDETISVLKGVLRINKELKE